MKSAIKMNTITAAIIGLLLSFSTVTLANDDDKASAVAAFKFVGNVKDQPIFELQLNNREADEFNVTFRDDNGNVIYKEVFKGASITKKFMLKAEDKGSATLNVVVRSKATGQTAEYIINRHQITTNEITVNKVK
jgi:hypothetical protein